MQYIKWNKVETKEDLPTEPRCYYFVLHEHEKATVCGWDEERNTDLSARVIACWAEIDLPKNPFLK